MSKNNTKKLNLTSRLDYIIFGPVVVLSSSAFEGRIRGFFTNDPTLVPDFKNRFYELKKRNIRNLEPEFQDLYNSLKKEGVKLCLKICAQLTTSSKPDIFFDRTSKKVCITPQERVSNIINKIKGGEDANKKDENLPN